MPKIELRNITKRFGGASLAVDNLTITIEDGDFVTLLGPSGCGKTTTLRQIAGLETPTKGDILIDGKLVYSTEQMIDVSPSKRDVGFLFQNYALWPHMTVYQNIAFGLENLKWSKSDIQKRVKELLGLLRIEEFVGRYPSELSGGQQQRVAIARTLATNPKVLLMDEPLSNLDAKLRMEMRTELKRLHRETGATFVYVTHDQLEAMTLATKICLLDKGVLQQYAPPLTVYNRPANIFVADFVGSPTINLLKVRETGETLVFETPVGKLRFLPYGDTAGRYVGEAWLGMRPEFVTASHKAQGKSIRARVLSSLPSGMETTLNLKIGESSLTSVIFGAVDFEAESCLEVTFPGDTYMLFDKEGLFVSSGRIEII